MGKKSKKAARAGGGAPAKPPRCTRCVSLVKNVAANAASCCPGCDRPFCKRCQIKDFLRCPHPDCPLPTTLRCDDCASGMSFARIAAAEGLGLGGKVAAEVPSHVAELAKLAEKIRGERPEALPFAVCKHASTSGCRAYGCWTCYERGIREAKETAVHPPLIKCDNCFSVRCLACNKNAAKKKDKEDTVVFCSVCYEARCLNCAGGVWSHWKLGYPGGPVGEGLTCRPCYWSTKPCTNPDCPNEVGVPTKRCGDCHRNRYCSKEYQIVMRSAHQEECAKMMRKREKKAARRAELADGVV